MKKSLSLCIVTLVLVWLSFGSVYSEETISSNAGGKKAEEGKNQIKNFAIGIDIVNSVFGGVLSVAEFRVFNFLSAGIAFASISYSKSIPNVSVSPSNATVSTSIEKHQGAYLGLNLRAYPFGSAVDGLWIGGKYEMGFFDVGEYPSFITGEMGYKLILTVLFIEPYAGYVYLPSQNLGRILLGVNVGIVF